MPGSTSYYKNGKTKYSDDVRFIGKEKYPKKVLIWIAKSEKPYFRLSKSVAVNSNIYINESLETKLLTLKT